MILKRFLVGDLKLRGMIAEAHSLTAFCISVTVERISIRYRRSVALERKLGIVHVWILVVAFVGVSISCVPAQVSLGALLYIFRISTVRVSQLGSWRLVTKLLELTGWATEPPAASGYRLPGQSPEKLPPQPRYLSRNPQTFPGGGLPADC